MATAAKQQLYINRATVYLRGGKNQGKTFQPFTCRDSLEHLQPHELQLVLTKGMWEPVEDYEQRQKAKES